MRERGKSPAAISKATIDRLPLYVRALRLVQEEGGAIISSDELGTRLGITPDQIRKDLAAFGQFGKKGVGYRASDLAQALGEILGLDRHWNLAVVGIGHMGTALANYRNFASLGFRMVALFDQNPAIIGTEVGGIRVEDTLDLERVVRERSVHIGIVAVPAPFAQDVGSRLADAGVKGIWNFAPVKVEVPDSVHIVNEDLSIGLSRLSYHISKDGDA